MSPSASLRVSVAVVQVGIMRVFVPERLVPMPMRMWFAGRIVRTMLMPVMIIMAVAVLMLQALMRVFVFMAFGHMQIYARSHQQTCANET